MLMRQPTGTVENNHQPSHTMLPPPAVWFGIPPIFYGTIRHAPSAVQCSAVQCTPISQREHPRIQTPDSVTLYDENSAPLFDAAFRAFALALALALALASALALALAHCSDFACTALHWPSAVWRDAALHCTALGRACACAEDLYHSPV